MDFHDLNMIFFVIHSSFSPFFRFENFQLILKSIVFAIRKFPISNSFLSFFLSIFTGSLIHEHYTRECEFGNFDKIKNKKTQKNNKKKHKKHKNFWLNFCLNKECPKLSWTGHLPQKEADYSNVE